MENNETIDQPEEKEKVPVKYDVIVDPDNDNKWYVRLLETELSGSVIQFGKMQIKKEEQSKASFSWQFIYMPRNVIEEVKTKNILHSEQFNIQLDEYIQRIVLDILQSNINRVQKALDDKR